MKEALNVFKREVTYKEATLTKEPMTKTETIEVPVTREELEVERRSAIESTTTTSAYDLKPPIITKEEIKIPLKREEIEVKKEPYIKEEVVIKKNV